MLGVKKTEEKETTSLISNQKKLCESSGEDLGKVRELIDFFEELSKRDLAISKNIMI